MLDSMKEITFFGRGGQGAVMASEILAHAYFLEGFQVQSFPSFGVERRGAPVTAFLRIAREFIYLRSMIYKADFGVVLASDLINSPGFAGSFKPGATVIVNCPDGVQSQARLNVSYVDASAIALEFGLGSAAQPIVNTAILGAFAAVTRDLKLENLLEAVRSYVPRQVEENLSAVRKAFETAVRLA